MAVVLRETDQCVDFFQQTILRAVRQWQESEAVQQVDVSVLDQNRLTILNVINRGLEYQPSWPELKQLVIALASYMERRGHWDAWREILNEAISVGQALHDFDGEITLTALFARLSQRQSRGQDVVRYYRRAIHLAKRHGNQYEEARACSNLGYYYVDTGHWWRSEVLSCHALALFEELGSEHGQAHTHNHLGLLYIRHNRWDEANHHLGAACDSWENAHDKPGLMRGYGNLGTLYVDKGMPDKALFYLKKAFELAETLGDNTLIRTFLIDMGTAYRLKNNFDDAKQYLNQAERICRNNSDHIGLAHIYHNQGAIAIREQNFQIAEPLLQQSIKTFQKAGFYNELIDTLFTYVDYAYESSELDTTSLNMWLDKLETLIAEHSAQQRVKHLEKRLARYRRSLTNM